MTRSLKPERQHCTKLKTSSHLPENGLSPSQSCSSTPGLLSIIDQGGLPHLTLMRCTFLSKHPCKFPKFTSLGCAHLLCPSCTSKYSLNQACSLDARWQRPTPKTLCKSHGMNHISCSYKTLYGCLPAQEREPTRSWPMAFNEHRPELFTNLLASL